MLSTLLDRFHAQSCRFGEEITYYTYHTQQNRVENPFLEAKKIR